MITGESRPVPRAVGDPVVAGTVSTDSAAPGPGRRRRRRHRPGRHPAAGGRGPGQRRPGPGAGRPVRRAAVLRRHGRRRWSRSWCGRLLGDVDEAVVRTVTVLVIACPHALGLAIPLVISLSTAVAARAGILVKDRLALERMRTVDAVLFDKTGTLTKGAHVVTGVAADPASGLDDEAVVRLAGGVESDSEHPLARAIVAAAGERGGARRRDRLPVASPAGASRPPSTASRYAVGGPGPAAGARRSRCPAALRPADRRVGGPGRGRALPGARRARGRRRPGPRGRGAARGPRRPSPTCGAWASGGDDHRRRPAGGRRRRPPTSASTRCSPRCCPRTRTGAVAELQAAGPARSPWWATGSTTPPPWPGPTSASPSAPAPTSPSSRPASCWPAATRAAWSGSSGCRGPSTARWSRTWRGPPATTSSPSRWPPASWPGPASPCRPRSGAILMSASTIVVAANAQLLRRVDLRPGTSTEPGTVVRQYT